MTVRTAELLMAVFLALASVALMYKSTDGLAIGWVRGTGPGSGAWPFWLSLIMLLSCIATIVRWFMRVTPQSRSEETFMDGHAIRLIGTTVLALVLLLFGTATIGLYFSLMLFLLFYLKVLGGHGWTATLSVMFGIPIFIFLFFEYLLVIPLPKGISAPLFYPIYAIIY